MLINSLITKKNLEKENFMSGDFETHEMNQPKISYLKERSENNTEWLDELVNKIEDMKNKITESA